MYCAAEDDENELARRAQAICAQLSIRKPTRGVLIPRKGKTSALAIMHEDARVELCVFYHELVGRLRGIPGHKIVVLDSAYDFVRFAGRAKIDEDAVNYFIKVVLQGICDMCDATLLIPWHPSQAGSGRDAMDGWSVAWHNAPRARLALSEAKDAEDQYELKVVKRNHGRKGPPLTLKYHDGALLPLDAIPDDGKTKSLRAACLKAARQAEEIGHPFKQQKNIPPSLLSVISKEAGVAVTSKRVKEELEAACFSGELTYRPGYGKVKAGYVTAVPRKALGPDTSTSEGETQG